MEHNYAYLQDKDFLLAIDHMSIKNQYVKITLLDFQENPIEDIQGKITGGSLNLDGSSSLRRTGNLSMIYDGEINNITVNKKIDLLVGFDNTLKKEYPQYKDYSIIWFPLGIYVITSASTSHGSGGTSISLQLKDKMCLLNGEVAGILPASIEFHQYDTVDEKGEWTLENPTIYQIIQELVNHFGEEQLSKIIINDVDTRIKQVMKWIGSSPLYVIQTVGVDGTIQYKFTTDENSLSNLSQNETFTTYEYGEDIGYIYTDFTYPGELLGDGGQSICDILDTIKNTLGNYEYFYDVHGNFIFQEIKNYLNTTKAKIEIDKINSSDYPIVIDDGKSVYTFDDATLVTSYSNNPQYQDIKNDFIVWGVRKDAYDNEFPIRYHLAIDKKPLPGNTYKVFFYEDPDDGLLKAKCPQYYENISEFPKIGAASVYYYSNANKQTYIWNSKDKVYEAIPVQIESITTKDWRTELYLQGASMEPYGLNSNYYYTELANEWTKLYNVQKGEFLESALKTPSDIDYFLDFIDTGLAIDNLSISNIGRRTKVVNDDKINCLFEPEIPNLVLINNGLSDDEVKQLREECELKGQDYVQVDQNLYALIAGGGAFNSAYVMVKELLDQYTKLNESISISAIPIYYLEPNTRITVRDEESGIYGDYMINSISLPFDTSGTMSLSCTKAMEKY